MKLRSAIVLGAMLVGSSALAQGKIPMTAAEMQAMLAKGLVVTSMDLSGGKQFMSRVNLGADGKITGSMTIPGQQPIPFTGAWKLKGAQLCRTLDPIQPEEVCETWLKSAPKEVTVQVGGKEVSMNRWQ
jgi:hypothetical protein